VKAPLPAHEQERLQAKRNSELRFEPLPVGIDMAQNCNRSAVADSAMEALRASEEFKGRLLACSRDCIKVLDLEGRLVYMNEGGMQSLEISDLAPVLKNFWFDFWEGQDREAARAAVDAARHGEIGRFTGYFETRINYQPRGRGPKNGWHR